MLVFLTFWCEGSQAKLRGLSAAPLSRGFRNVTWQDVFGPCPFTSSQTQYKYKRFATHNETLTLFSNVSLLRVAEWSRVEWSAVEWSRGHWLRGWETLLKPVFRNLWANFLVKQLEFELFSWEAWPALSVSFATLQKRYRTKGFWSKIW